MIPTNGVVPLRHYRRYVFVIDCPFCQMLG